MKKLTLTLLTIVVLGFMMVLAGCGGGGNGDGEADGPLKGKDIVGEWKVCGAEYIGIEMDLEDLDWTPDSCVAVIKADGTIDMKTDDGNFSGDLVDNGDETYTLTVEAGEDDIDFIFSVGDDGKMTSDWSDFFEGMYIYFEK